MSLKDQKFAEMKKLAKRANQRLLELERLTGKSVSWAAKQLMDRLDIIGARTKKNRISFKKSFDIKQMNKVISATMTFLNAKTSTISGIKDVTKKAAETFHLTHKISIADAEAIYSLFDKEYYDNITKHIDPSSLINLVSDSRKKNLNQKDTLKVLGQYIQGTNDRKLKDDLKQLYKDLIKGGLIGQYEGSIDDDDFPDYFI